MAFEVIRSIVDAEKEAENIRLSAVENAADIRRKAVKEAEKTAADTVKESAGLKAQMVAEAVAESRGEVDRITKEAEKTCAGIEAAAAKKMEKAADAVIGKVVGADGYS